MLLEFFRNWGRVSGRQSGALPYVIVDNRVVFLLVTARRTGRWIFPKGSISAGMSPWDSAAKEAMEDAGVTGEISRDVIGTYWITDKGRRTAVDLYPMSVEQQFDSWKEKEQRLRHWALLPEVQRLIADRALARIASDLQQKLQRRPSRRRRSG